MPQPITVYQWTADYAVGVRQIDEEHQQLFELAEEMHQALLQGKGKAMLDRLLACLIDYAGYHFEHEEQLMQRIQYPDYAQHRQQHEAVRSGVRALQERAAAGEVTMTIEVMQFLIEWLKRHTIASDRRITSYLKTSMPSMVS